MHKSLLNFNKILSIIAIAFFIVSFFLISSKTFAATGILKQINFQGKVVNANGTNVANGNYDFVFSIYTVASAGTAVWTETRTLANQVTVTDGIFRVSLGSITALPGSIDFNTDNIYLGINFNSDGEMTPRVRFTAVPYAFNALKVAGLTVTDTTGTFTLAAAKTLTVNNTLTFSGTDATTLTFQGTDTYVGRATTDTLTNKTIGSTGLTFSAAATDITTAANEDFTLTPNGTGNTIFTSDFNSGLLIGSSSNTLAPFSVTGGIGSNALAILNQTNSGDLLTASSSGTTKFRIANNGDAVLSAAINLGGTNGTSSQCLLGGSSAAWGSCSAGAGSNWDIVNGVITPKLTSTLDFLLGSAATTSAKFAVLNINSGAPTATISATTTGLSLSAAGTIQSLQNATLTIGGNTTGTIILSPLSGSGTVSSTGDIDLLAGKVFRIASGSVLSSTVLGSTVTASSLQTVGTISTGIWQATAVGGGYGGTGVGTYATGDLLYAGSVNPTSLSKLAVGNMSQVLGVSSGVPAWIDSSTIGAIWQIVNGSAQLKNTTLDLLVGATASTSAKFAVLNINSGTPTASVSAGTNGGSYFSAAGVHATTAKQTLTLGDANTGEIQLSPGGTLALTGRGINLIAAGTLTGLTGLTVASGTVSLPSGQIDNVELANSSITVSATAGTGISITGSPVSLGGTLTLAGIDASTSIKGVASFNAANFAVAAGDVTIKSGGVTTTEIAANTIDFADISDSPTLDGTTTIALGTGVQNFNLVLGTNATNGNIVIQPNAGGQAALIIDKKGINDIFTASASGATKFTVNNSGDLVLGSTTRLTNAGVGTFITGSVLGSQTFTTNNIADSGGLTITSGGAGNLAINSAGGTVTSNATTVTFGSATVLNLAANSAINPNASGTISLGTGVNTTGLTLGKAATTTTFNSTSWTATPTISGLITASSGVSVAANQSYTGAGAVTLSSGGSSGLTFDSASGDITVAANDGLTFAATTLGNNGSRNVTINSGTGGTTATLIVKLDTSGTVVTTDTTTLNNAVGVALNTTTAGQAVRVAINGVVTATADNAVTAGDYIGLGTTTAGRAKSLGTTYPSTAGVQVIGRALGSQATPGSTFLLMLNGIDNNVTAGGGGGYNLIKDETTSLTARTTLAFLGTAVTCADNAGLTQTECTISGAGGGVSFASGTPDNTVTSNKLIHLQKSGADKFVVANSGGLTITAGTSDTVKTTTGTTLATDFSLTGSTLTNVTSANDLISINDGSVTNTMSTSTVVTAAAAGAGSHTILREDGMYIIIHGNSLATGSRWDGSSTTMTSVTVATGAVLPGAGSIALKRPDGRYLIVHGNASAGLTSLFDPWGVTAIAAGPAVCGAGAATTGTNAFLRQDGKYVILCGNLTAWGVYDPTANTYTAGTAVGTAFGAGAHAIQRDDGTFLVFRGANTTNHWIYNPFASATGTMTADPIVTTPPTINTGAFSIRRADGKFLVIGGAVNASTIYDPTRTSANSGAGTMTPQTVGAGFGPTVALGDGAQSLWRQDGKYLLIAGNLTTTNVIDPSKTDSTQFVAGPALNANAAAGIHAVMRPDGAYQIIRGGATTTTDIYNTGFIIGGSGTGNQLASYETECITATSLNATSTLKWTGNSEGRMWFQVKTGTGACSGSYKDIKNSGDLINPVAGDNRVQIKVFLQRDLPKFADQEWGVRRGLGQTRYRRTNKDPALYDVTVDNSTSFHRSQFEFGNSSDPSGPVMVNLTNNSDRNLAIALEMGVGYGSTINATNPQFYNGAFGTHPALATSATAGTVVMKRPDGKFMLVAGNTTTANAQLYDPIAQTFTAQSGAGNIPTAGTGLGALAIKRPNGTYLMLVGNAGTVTNIYDPLGASGSQFVAGPALTAAAGRGAITIPLPNGRVLIMHGNFTSTSSIYDPIQNTMVAGPTPSAVIGGGAMAIPRPNGTYFVVLGIATEACTALNTVTNNFDPYTMIFTATGSPAITTGVGPGAFAFQRSDGQWVIVHGGGTATTCAGTTRAQIYNPITNQSVVGPVLSGVAQHGAHAIQKPDGTWLVVHGGALTTTSTYLEKTGAFTTGGLAGIGQFIAGPALVTAVSAGSISFQRDDGKFVTITGNAGTVTQQYDGGWVSNGTYRSEAINIADLDSTSALVWQANADLTNISAEVRTATSKDNLQIATFREVPTSGGLINPSASETWVNVNFNFKRTFPSYGGIYTDTWYNGGSPIQFAQRKIVIPTLNEFKITKDVDLINLKSDGLSVFRVNSDGDIYTSSYGSVNTGGADLAENYTSQVHLEKGEVVSIDPQNNHGVKRASYQYQPDILGIVSTEPGFVAGSYTKDSYPIALVGRVPVKVSTENGLIRVGDYITASSVPGYAMKATKAGRVLGKALETIDSVTLIECPPSDFQIPGRKCGTVMVFVNLTDYLGAPVELVMEDRKTQKTQNGGLSESQNSGAPDISDFLTPSGFPSSSEFSGNTKQDQILAFLKQLKEEQASSSAQVRSEIFTDRVSATHEVISPQIITDILYAKKIKADSIEGLEILTDKISARQTASSSAVIVNSAAQSDSSPAIASMSATLQSDKSVEFGGGKFTLDLTILGTLNANSGLIVLGPSQFKGESIFEKLVTFVSNVIFKGDVTFMGTSTFNKDTAGLAVITKDTDQVVIVFEKEYAQMPFVTVGITLDVASKNFVDKTLEEQTQAQETLENDLLSYDLKYFVTKRDSKGFAVKLNKKAPVDVPFSWHAIAVKDSVVFKSKPPVIEPTSAPLPTLEPTIEPSISPSQEATGSAATN